MDERARRHAPTTPRLLAGQASLAGRTAFVPGGYGGIGAAIAWGLALAGARVAVAGRSAAKAEALAARPARGRPRRDRRRHGRAFDRRHPRRRRRGRRALRQRSTCSSTASASSARSATPTVSEAAFDEVVQVNLKAAMFMSQAAARHQVAAVAGGRAAGRQVHLLSVRAQLGMRDRGYSAYCAPRARLVMLIKQHAVELVGARHHRQRRRADRRPRRDGRALAGEPGDARAAATRAFRSAASPSPKDVVGAALFFCGPAAYVRHRPDPLCRRRHHRHPVSAGLFGQPSSIPD